VCFFDAFLIFCGSFSFHPLETLPAMTVNLYKLLIDGGLLILIWMVQLVVYPSFCYFSEADIKIWHPIYTKQITLIVLPLMVSQLGLYTFTTFQKPSAIQMLSLGLVILIWGVTFLKAVPLHAQIEHLANSVDARNSLVQINWVRTIAWTIIFILSLAYYEK